MCEVGHFGRCRIVGAQTQAQHVTLERRSDCDGTSRITSRARRHSSQRRVRTQLSTTMSHAPSIWSSSVHENTSSTEAGSARIVRLTASTQGYRCAVRRRGPAAAPSPMDDEDARSSKLSMRASGTNTRRLDALGRDEREKSKGGARAAGSGALRADNPRYPGRVARRVRSTSRVWEDRARAAAPGRIAGR